MTSPLSRTRTAPAIAAIVALILVLAFGNSSYAHWAARQHLDAWGLFLKELAWPAWSFSSNEAVRTLLADDLRAILVVILAAVFVAIMVGSELAAARGTIAQFFTGWGAYMFAGAFAGLITAFVRNASVLNAFLSAEAGAAYGLFVGWIIGLAVFGAKR
jgi:hypothetical protein